MSHLNLKPGASNLRYDLPAALVVFLVALPLCLGVAVASGVPAFSGIIAGAVGGIVIGILSGSPLSVSGPAAGLTVIVLSAVNSLPSFEAFLLAVFISGIIQLLLGVIKAGLIGDFIPSAVIRGMLAAIGLILILKQIPHAVGYDRDYEGDFSFSQPDGRNTISEITNLFNEALSTGAILIAVVSLIILNLWESKKVKNHPLLQYIPGPLLVVVFGILANVVFNASFPDLAIAAEHLVNIPVAANTEAFLMQFTMPDFNHISNPEVWITAFTLAIVASVETLLSIEAVDKIDPFKRISPTNRELMAQGAGNMVSGLIGGMPVTSVIVRSSANVSSGGRTRVSTIVHGSLLLLSVALMPRLLNMIPLSALAAVLIAVGYKLTKPEIFVRKWRKGYAHFFPFVITIIAILLTDLLVGVVIGLVAGSAFILFSNFKSSITYIIDGRNHLLRFKKNLSFIHKLELRKILRVIPDDVTVMIDLSKIDFVDYDNAEILNDFIDNAALRGVEVIVKRNETHAADIIKEPTAPFL
jgi:carbonic anhydrase